jgi:hypothetical protein
MKRQVPKMMTDEEAEAFLDQDLSDLDFSQFKPVKLKLRSHHLAPGTPAPRSGVYHEVGPRGGKAGVSISLTRGKLLPPTRRGGSWELVSAARGDGED